MMPSGLHDADTSANGSTDQKIYVAPVFNFVDLRNSMMSLMMPLVSPDAYTNANNMM